MAAMIANMRCGVLRDNELLGVKILPPKIGLDDGGRYMFTDTKWRCDTFMQRDPPSEALTPHLCLSPSHNLSTNNYRSFKDRDPLGFTELSPPSYDDPPPSYIDAEGDTPPSYAHVDPFIYPQRELTQPHLPKQPKPKTASDDKFLPSAILEQDPIAPMTAPIVDFKDSSNYRQVGNNKKKKAQQKSKWEDSGDEGNKDGAGAAENGAEGGGENNGDGGASGAGGGDGGDGGGEDEWGNDWNAPKKKKGKKGKGVDEEEEKKKKQEEEEQKRKEEEAAWANGGDINATDDWGGFTATTKKGKKNKKDKAQLEPEATKASLGAFDDIHLGDGPQLDLSFGETDTKNTESKFGGFGGWGTSWNTTSKWGLDGTDTGTTNTTDNAKGTEDTSVEAGDIGAWSSFGGNKKNKKKTTNTGFDFGNFGTIEETKDEAVAAEADGWGSFEKNDKKNKKKGAFEDLSAEPDSLAMGTATEEPAGDDSRGAWGTTTSKGKKKGKKDQNEDIPPVPLPQPTAPEEADWNSFGSGSKKDKRKGKKDTTEDYVEQSMHVAAPEPDAVADPAWGSFGAKKDNKKKGKKNQAEEKPGAPVIVAVPEEPEPEPEPEPDLSWSSFGTSKRDKDKKKGKKGVSDEPNESAAVKPGPGPEADFDWGGFGANKKDKKGTNKNTFEDPTTAPVAAALPEPEGEADLSWAGFGTSKKGIDKKKGKKNAWEESETILAPMIPEAEPVVGAGWGFGNKNDKDKGKKGNKNEPVKDEPAIAIIPEPESTLNVGWGISGAKKEKNKKGKNKGFFDDDNDAAATTDVTNTIGFPDFEPTMDDDPAAWGTTTQKGKKGKKGLIAEVREDPTAVIDSAAAIEAPVADDSWMNWGAADKKNNKKGKKGTAAEAKNEEALPPPPPPPPAAPEASMTDLWGSTKKDKKGKKGATFDKAKEEIPMFPDPGEFVPKPAEEDFEGWGLSAKDKKRKEKEKEKERKEKEEKEKQEKEEKEKAEKEKAKPGKKGRFGIAAEPSKALDMMEDSVPDIAPVVEDPWSGNMWGASAKSKKKGGKNAIPDIPPPVPTPPSQGLTPEPEMYGALDDVGDDGWASFAPAKVNGKISKTATKTTKAEDSKAAKKSTKAKNDDDALPDFLNDNAFDEPKKRDTPKEESAAKAAKGFWGSIGTTSAAKSKFAKDSGEKTCKDLLGLDDLDDEIIGIVEEPPKKGSKTKTDNKLAKTGSKESNTSDKAAKASSDKKKQADEGFLDDVLELGDEGGAPEQADGKKEDAWSFWGSTKKTGGQKADEGKKEITKAEMTNQKGSLRNNLKKEPEATIAAFADESLVQPAKPFRAAMSTAKATKTSAVLQRVKDLEQEKGKAKGKASEADTQPPAPELEPLSKTDFPPKKPGAAGKLKGTAASNSASAKKKETYSPVATVKDNQNPFQNFVPGTFPGSFPAEGADDDIVDFIDLPPTDKKTNKKSAKSKKNEPIMNDNLIMDEFDFDVHVPVPEAPPTPPPEPTAAKPAAKKERARVVRDEGASSWGFWGASPKKDPKKESKSKDDADALAAKAKAKTPAPGLTRSKSTRTAKEKEKEVEKSSKSSASDEKDKKSQSRPSKSRGSSFGFFGGPPPVRAKPVRRPSTAASKTASSRRQSMDVDATGLPSPPADDAPEMNAKAANLMGAGPGKLDRKASTRGKAKSKAVPDPYPIDDDDMVMIGGLGDPVVDEPPPTKTPTKKDKPSKSKSKKEQTQPVDDFAEDVVMVDASSPQDDLDGPKENLAFDERPRLQRANTSAKKSKGGMMGLFGGFGKSRRASEAIDKPKSKGVLTDDEGLSHRKRPVAGNDDYAKRLRRDDRKVRREKEDRAAEGYVYDASATNGVVDDPEAQARREERRAERASRKAEKVPEDARKPKAKDTRERRSRKEEEAEAIRFEEKRARRAARDEMNAKLSGDPSSSRPRKSDRRRSHMDPPISAADEDAERRARREARRAARIPGEKSSKKKTVDDYFDPRNGTGGGADPYMNGAANDPTSSWVKSQLSTPADPPPLEPTVIEPPPVLGGGGGTDPAAEDEDARRAKRKSRRQSRYADGAPPPEDGERRRRKEREIRSSEGSREEDGGARPSTSRRKSDMSGLKSFDARPSLAAGGKRGSWFKKMGL